MKCTACQWDNPLTGRFCSQCGTGLPQGCPACQRVCLPGSRYCSECGARLSAGSERRHLTVLFCDIVASTALARTLDPEELNEITRRYYRSCAEAIERYEGTIANYIGDGVMALFGYPRSHEDDSQRAVLAALEIVRTASLIATGANQRLQVRAGIATGLVVVGEDGEHALTKEKTVVGETPNLASHLQSAAAPNSILIAASTRQLVRDAFELEAMGRMAGDSPAWRVWGSKVLPSRFAARTGQLTPFVGRNRELERLAQAWQGTREGRGGTVVLVGEAGIGKSRIVEAFRHRLAGEAPEVLLFQCSPHHVDSALHPVVVHWEAAADIESGDGAATRLAKLSQLLQSLPVAAPDALPLLASLLSIPLGAHHPPVEPDAQRRRERTLQLLLERLAAAVRPTLVVVEDVHWADPSTLDLVSRLMLLAGARRLLLVVTHRPECTPAWPEQAAAGVLSLGRLDAADAGAMIDGLTVGRPLPADVHEQLVAMTDGVPLFLEELTQAVLESAASREAAAAGSPGDTEHALRIPATLQDSLQARLDRQPLAREVAQVAATIGREFGYELLLAVAQLPEEGVCAGLAQLCASTLVSAQGESDGKRYVFKHALVQEAAYETLLKSRRQQLHGRIAAVLEQRFADLAHGQPELMAHHCTRAGLSEQAVVWWERAGDLAIKRSANLEAVRHFNRALELLRSQPASAAAEDRELALRVKLSGPLIATGGYVTPALADNYALAWALCTRLGRSRTAFPILYGQWVIPYVRGDMAVAWANAQRFLERAQQQPDDGLLLMGHRIFGSSLVWRGETQAGSEHLRQALALYRAPDHDELAYVFSQHPRVAARAHLCLALQHLGRFDEAMQTGWDAIAEARRIEHFNSLAYALCFVSLMIMLRRDVETLERTATELLELAERHKAAYWTLWARPMLGWIEAQRGRMATGLAQMRESTEQLQRQGANLWVPQTLLLQAEVLAKAGQAEPARELLDAAQALIEPLEQRFYEAELHRVRGNLLLARDAPAGLACLDRAIRVAHQQGSPFLELRARISKAAYWRERGSHENARALLDPVMALFPAGHDSSDLREARELAGRFG